MKEREGLYLEEERGGGFKAVGSLEKSLEKEEGKEKEKKRKEKSLNH